MKLTGYLQIGGLLLAAGTLAAQTATDAAIRGVVRDSQGAALGSADTSVRLVRLKR
jgi:hypothetical protein